MVFGDSLRPFSCCGGGNDGDSGARGGNGGGRLHILAQSLVVDGAIIADGGDAEDQGKANGSVPLPSPRSWRMSRYEVYSRTRRRRTW